MAEITTADLLKVQENITGTVRYEVGQARVEFRERIDELKEVQKTQDQRADEHARELARLDERTKVGRGLLSALSPKQKAALWSAAIAVGGVVVDGVRHAVVFLLTLYAKGVHP